MRKPFTVFEHECTTGFDWTDKDLTALDRLNRAAGAEILRPLVLSGKRELRAAQHVGVVRLGGRSIQVLPKIYHKSDEATDAQRAREATRNLLHLLQLAGDVPVREQGLAALLRRKMEWFEILTRLFAKHLREEWQRGASRGYRLIEEDQPALKGKWCVAEQVRRPGRDHLFAVAYDNFTADNQLNRVFRFVVERLWGVTRDADNRQVLGELRQWLDEVMLLPSLNASDAGSALLTRMNRRLEPLLNLARMFLNGGVMQMAAGDQSAFAFVFDMNRVFEAFVVNFTRRHRQHIVPPEMWDCDLLPQARGASLCLARSDGKPAFRLKPDLALCSGHAFPLLVDAKYKGLAPDAAAVGVAQADFNQMFAYAHRYDCPRVLLLYPQTADTPGAVYKEFTLECANRKTVAVATVDIRVDLSSGHGRMLVVERLGQLFQSKGALP